MSRVVPVINRDHNVTLIGTKRFCGPQNYLDPELMGALVRDLTSTKTIIDPGTNGPLGSQSAIA